MHGLSSIPSHLDLEKAYEKLLSDSVITTQELATLSQWSRFDPRLGEILVQFFYRHWKNTPSALLHDEIIKEPWPAALGVILEHVFHLLPRKSRKEFEAWKRSTMWGIEKAQGELFFIGVRSFAGKFATLDAERALTPFRKWGYLASDLMVNKARQTEPQTLLSSSQRRLVLKQLIRQRSRISVEDYMRALTPAISRRQAERDLARNSKLAPVGQTKGRFYWIRKSEKRTR